MKANKLLTMGAVLILAGSLAGCKQFGKQNVGIAAGGVTGALVGDALFDGSPVGVAAGAVGGALAGNAIAKNTK
jgi:hypothetical protein